MPEHFHKMIHTGSEADFEIFYCPDCERAIAIRFDPYEKKVLVPGDTSITHAGNFFGSAFADQQLTNFPIVERLEPFEDWVESRPDLFGGQDVV